ncbi:MAG: sodium/glutamate symporter [Clostridium fessum]
MQDAVGSGLAAAFGLNPLLGLCMGSMPLVGGHGTSPVPSDRF